MNLIMEKQRLLSRLQQDAELTYKLRDLDAATVRLELPGQSIDITITDGHVMRVGTAEESTKASLTFSASDTFWVKAFENQIAPPGYETLTMAMANGLTVTGEFPGVLTDYQGAWQRLFLLLREATSGSELRKPYQNPFRETDNAVGRYIYVQANGTEARIYYEEAGNGQIPLMLQSTAGTDGRQYRHLLADPEMQSRFRMIAYDLPYHGKSLPPTSDRWWEIGYHPTLETLTNWIVAIADALDLDQPYFMGCSVGGQLALDLAAEHPDRFGAFISLNGWYDSPPAVKGIDNNLFRSPSVSEDYPMSLILGATAPSAPESLAQETYWIYRSNFPGVYAGDNDYFLHGHDLKINGHKIDALSKAVYVITGEYDAASHDDVHGGPAVAKNIPGARFIMAKGLGHFAPCDDPIGFRDAIIPILDEIIAGPSTEPVRTVTVR